MVAPNGPVYQAGTFGNLLAMAAARTGIARKPGFYESLEAKASKLAARIERAAMRAEAPLALNRVGSMMTPFFTQGPVTDYASAKTSDTERFASFFHALLERGVYWPPSQFEAGFVSSAHSDETSSDDRAVEAAPTASETARAQHCCARPRIRSYVQAPEPRTLQAKSTRLPHLRSRYVIVIGAASRPKRHPTSECPDGSGRAGRAIKQPVPAFPRGPQGLVASCMSLRLAGNSLGQREPNHGTTPGGSSASALCATSSPRTSTTCTRWRVPAASASFTATASKCAASAVTGAGTAPNSS
jgi:hypothetical protein